MHSTGTTIAILGATSHIAKGLIARLRTRPAGELALFARAPERITAFLEALGVSHASVRVLPMDRFASGRYDVVINCVGIGDPAVLRREIASIFRLTEEMDNLVLDYLQLRQDALYINFSSGAVYGTDFELPAGDARRNAIDVNHLAPGQFYGIAKLHAEAKHRACKELNIVDLRVFSYFSRHIDLQSSFLLCEIVTCIRNGRTFVTGPDDIQRDYVHPDDLTALIGHCIEHRRLNGALDVYSREPVSKFAILEFFAKHHGLQYRIEGGHGAAAPTGAKSSYYSLSRKAAGIGYQPRFASLDCIREESQSLLRA
jgi:nucleoside-diphosphate-sugar epimerase